MNEYEGTNANLENIYVIDEKRNVIHDVCWIRRPANMARPLSNDLRARAVARHQAGESIRSVAATFGVAPSSVSKWTADVRPRTGWCARLMASPSHQPLGTLQPRSATQPVRLTVLYRKRSAWPLGSARAFSASRLAVKTRTL